MKPFKLACGRFALFMAVAFGAAYYVNSRHHESYWHGTIHRVQTVDFNILAHMLPTKLSHAVVQGDMEELQRTLESNYGHFGLVVTDCRTALPDCPGQEIYAMNSSSYGWHQSLEERGIDYLLETEAPYDLLRYPLPLLTEGGYDDSRDTDWNDTGRENPGEIIGRVYYVRGVPPRFHESYWEWFRQWPQSFYKDSQAYRYYGLTATLFLAAGLGGWGVGEMLLAKNRMKERQLDSTKQELHQTKRDLAYAQRLVEDRERQLQRQQRLLADKEVERQRLSQEIQTRETQLQQQQQFQAEYETQLSRLEDLLQSLQTDGSATQAEIQQRHEQIVQLQEQIRVLSQRIIESEERKRVLRTECGSLNEQLQSATQTIESQNREIQGIQRELKAAADREQRARGQATRLQATIKQSGHDESYIAYVENENEQLSKDKKCLEDQIKGLQARVKTLESKNANLSWRLGDSDSEPASTDDEEFNTDDLSKVNFGIAGGHQDFQNSLLRDLIDRGLPDSYVQMTTDERVNRQTVHQKFDRCNLVVLITYHSSHNLSKLVRQLVPLPRRFETAESCEPLVVEQILAYIRQHPEQFE